MGRLIGVAKTLSDMLYGIDERRIATDARYEYSVTAKGSRIVGRIEKEFELVLSQIKILVETCRQYCKLNPKSLSFAANTPFGSKVRL